MIHFFIFAFSFYQKNGKIVVFNTNYVWPECKGSVITGTEKISQRHLRASWKI